ncbi:two-component system, NarL family, sensor histidine kinase DegS [Proteiniborus ethanoligenes]|uniref:Oxygen sensor histidine kinase NreB n=1 Tax=Proteiniborus ethanoligenes TaxID=415015 RepID=A0A1H3LA92_9FIRM|nr:sensor histidine kinase [Proteiniborus ethanoligenes]SDY60874.1 two-component system, NarL family, sensor histidine kinase DegS [Proteiniborus ethanoligenes]
MSKPSLDLKRMNEIIEKTINTIDSGRKEIFDIAENARKECERIKNEINAIQDKISAVILETDDLAREERRTKSKLMVVSRDFNKYSEQDIRLAYEEANNIKVRLVLKRQEEKELISKRNSLEVSLRKTFEIVEKAERLVSQVGVAMDFLKGNLNDIFETIEDMNKKQSLGIKIIEAQEEERMRVSREIHDGPAQSMANVVLKAELCEKLLNIDLSQAKDELNELKDIARNSIKDVRRIIYDLRPMSLDDLGLIPTLQRYIDKFMEETGINVDLMILDNPEDIKPIIEIACFRIIQEALNNVSKHSKAKEVLIKIEYAVDKLFIVIKDNGIGFEKDKLKRSKDLRGYGLIGMKERAELLSGKLDIISSLGEGTKVLLTIPLEREEVINE